MSSNFTQEEEKKQQQPKGLSFFASADDVDLSGLFWNDVTIILKYF